jgi:hypothetical protein
MFQAIKIDASELQENFNVDPIDVRNFVSNVVSELAVEYLRYWDKEASVLKSSKSQYKNALYTNKIDDLNYEVGLIGWLPNAIEQGLEGFDEKEGFRKSSKIHESKDGGWYLTIPFRHAMAGALGESEIFSGVMPSEVYREAKKLADTGKGLQVGNLPQEYQVPKIRPQVVTKSKVFEQYQHKSSIYAEMQRKVDSTGRGNYQTFRRVSDNSDDNSWIHTGIEARNFHDKALRSMDVPATVDVLASKFVMELL